MRLSYAYNSHSYEQKHDNIIVNPCYYNFLSKEKLVC